jgi:NADPH-dependent 2,4-dienoyl-CoA reductase/sulfur reductase-like enzyme
MKVIVIGGVAAGMSAASKLKRVLEQTEITVYEKGGYLSYGACGLPYFLADYFDDDTKMIARTKEDFEKMGISCRLHHEVIKVIPDLKQVMIKNLITGEIFHDSYDKLMVASGAPAVLPPFEGIGLDNIETLKTMEDGLRLKALFAKDNIKRVAIVGGGYIGVEMSEALRAIGKETYVIQSGDRVLKPFDREFSEMAGKEMEKNGVRLILGERVKSFSGYQAVNKVITDKSEYDVDFVLVALGVRPDLSFLEGLDYEKAENGAILVDAEMRTSIEDVYAAGDCAAINHMIKDKHAYIALGTTANKGGRIAGENIAGAHVKYVGTLGSAAIKVFDLELARTGLGETEALEAGLDFKTVVVKAPSSANYYPGASPLLIKVIYENGSGRILGAQAAGTKGAVHRVDMFAIAIQANMTTDDLGNADLCYAPPFASVWDAVNIACNAAK